VIPLELLHGKVVVITGATEGFGAEAARAFCSAGAVLVLAARPDDLPGTLAHDCEAHGAQTLVVPTVPGRRADVHRLAHGVVGLSAALREELRESGLCEVHVCTVLPGPVDGDGIGVPSSEPPWLASPYDPQDVVDTIVRLASAPEAVAVIRARPARLAPADPGGNGRVRPEVPSGARGAARPGVPPTLDAARAGAAYTRLESPPA
jgi:NAD(P)-dependent dehydrogenase (short-subunit alcohol dehydrogenase family)